LRQSHRNLTIDKGLGFGDSQDGLVGQTSPEPYRR
jgi:hypothetical protein